MIPDRIAAVLSAVLICLGCTSGEPPSVQTESPAASTESVITESSDTSTSGKLSGPAIVLDGTDIFEVTSFDLRPLDESSVGSYGAEQGGSVLSLTLSLANGTWTVERIHQEPGETRDLAVYTVKLRDGMLISSDEDVSVRGTKEGVLVFERASGIISADYWVHYLRRT